jgi:hypothetical protein
MKPINWEMLVKCIRVARMAVIRDIKVERGNNNVSE